MKFGRKETKIVKMGCINILGEFELHKGKYIELLKLRVNTTDRKVTQHFINHEGYEDFINESKDIELLGRKFEQIKSLELEASYNDEDEYAFVNLKIETIEDTYWIDLEDKLSIFDSIEVRHKV